MSGVLATNVVFVPVEGGAGITQRKFVAQIDHVLVFESGAAMVIESKNWSGIVFDGKRPSEVHPAFRNLLDESHLDLPFAIQVRSRKTIVPTGGSELWWQVRVEAGGNAPGKQALVQATRLAEYVKQHTGVAMWFDACVFYSHPDAVAYVEPRQDITQRGRARVVSDGAGLQKLMKEGSSGRPTSPTQLKAVVMSLSELGAHLRPLGTFTLPR